MLDKESKEVVNWYIMYLDTFIDTATLENILKCYAFTPKYFWHLSSLT